MKVLVVSESVGRTATGIVAQRLIAGISRYADVYVLSGDISGNIGVKKENIYISKFGKKNPYVVLLSFILFNKNILEKEWGSEHFGTMPRFDLVVSFVSYGHYAALTTSNNLTTKQSCPHVSYFVDAIPTPSEYVGNNHYLKLLDHSLRIFIRKQTKKVSVLYSTCLEMSEYQRSVINNSKIQFDELLNPVPFSDIIKLRDVKKPIFIYAGQVYSPRTPRYVLDAFAKLLKDFPKAELHFIGTKYLNSFLSNCDRIMMDQVKIVDFMANIEQAYSEGCALIDIGCNVEHDIFMSSKLSGYIPYNRPIICECSGNSAPRRIFKEDSSVFLCNHNSNDILNAMRICICQMGHFDYSIREQIIKQFSIESISNKILKDFSNINDNQK